MHRTAGHCDSRAGARTARRALAGAAVALALIAAPEPARAGTASEGLLGISAAVCSLVYAPLKLTYAVGGTAIGSLAWLWTFGDTGVSGPIFRSSLRGDYVVTPDHLRRRRDLEFVGK